MVVGGDLVESDDAGDAFDISVVADPAVDALDVLGLVRAGDEVVGAVGL